MSSVLFKPEGEIRPQWRRQPKQHDMSLMHEPFCDLSSSSAVPQCDTLDISIGPLDNITTQPVPPYYLISYPADATPSIFDASSANGGVFSWNMGYPPGTQLLLGMVDSKGNSGGIVRVYSVGAGASNCQMYSTTNDDFSFRWV